MIRRVVRAPGYCVRQLFGFFAQLSATYLPVRASGLCCVPTTVCFAVWFGFVFVLLGGEHASCTCDEAHLTCVCALKRTMYSSYVIGSCARREDVPAPPTRTATLWRRCASVHRSGSSCECARFCGCIRMLIVAIHACGAVRCRHRCPYARARFLNPTRKLPKHICLRKHAGTRHTHTEDGNLNDTPGFWL
jgi:hypothetical protein